MRIYAKSLIGGVAFALAIGSGTSAEAAKPIPEGPALPAKAIP